MKKEINPIKDLLFLMKKNGLNTNEFSWFYYNDCECEYKDEYIEELENNNIIPSRWFEDKQYDICFTSHYLFTYIDIDCDLYDCGIFIVDKWEKITVYGPNNPILDENIIGMPFLEKINLCIRGPELVSCIAH